MSLTFQDKTQRCTPQWVIDRAPTPEFGDVNVKSRLFDEDIRQYEDEQSSKKMIWPDD